MSLPSLFSVVPTTINGVLILIVEMIVIFTAIILSDKFIGHSFEPKNVLIMSILAYFLTPITQSFLSSFVSIRFGLQLFPLVVWLILGEIFLKKDADMKTKLKVALLAFVIYEILSLTGIVGRIIAAVL